MKVLAVIVALAAALGAACGGNVGLPEQRVGARGDGVPEAAEGSSGSGGGSDRPLPRPVPPGRPVETPDASTPPSTLPSCASPAPFDPATLDASFGAFRGPALGVRPCSASDLARAEANLQTAASIDEAFAGLQDDCRRCLVTPATADAWGPVVVSSNGGAIANLAACYGVVSRSLACARAIHDRDVCQLVTCGACETVDEFEACSAAVVAPPGPCAPAVAAAASTCSDLAALAARCGDLPDAYREVCGAE